MYFDSYIKSFYPGTQWTADDAEGLWTLVEDKLLFAKVAIINKIMIAHGLIKK